MNTIGDGSCFAAGSTNEQECLKDKFDHLWHLIGNTPMIEIAFRYKGEHRKLYVKCEQYNLTGSIKDRMALYILQKASMEGKLHPDSHIVEATSGNAGISFSAIGRASGLKVTIMMPNWVSQERIALIKSMGADIMLFTKEEGGFMRFLKVAESVADKDPRIFLPRQFDNIYNAEAHKRTTAKEIWMQMQSIDLTPDAFVAGVGTGGTIMGIGAFLKERHPHIKIHPLEPLESPSLSTGHKPGLHRIQGILDEFIPAMVDLAKLDPVVQVADGDSILMAQMLAGELGLGVGISSGANFLGAVQLQNEMGNYDAVVVTVFSDSNKKYLNTDLLREEPVKEEYISSEIELLNYRAIERVY